MNTAPWLLCGLAAATLTLPMTGCRAFRSADDSPAGAGPNAMLDEVAVGKNRCPDEDDDARPFVVEWDATDLATFEAKASRDLVFVRYEQCGIELLYGCSDNGVPGRYGAYASPVFTSGTVESFEMRNYDELWAKLPLGAASFGGKLEVGETLELQYFVSGAVASTRNYVERGTIADNPRCAKATHFVSAYNLGAFRLLAHQQQARAVEGGVGQAGGGSQSESESANLKHGGDLDSCLTHGQQRCRVPIRLVLQPIDETSTDLDAGAAGAPRPDPEPAPVEDTASARAEKLRVAAMDKRDAGDGPGCLADLDRADALAQPSEDDLADVIGIRATCTMLAGQCEPGRAMYLEAIGLADKGKTASEIQIQAAVGRAVQAYCPIEQLDEDARGMALWTRARAAATENKPKVCNELAETALKLIERQRKAGKQPDSWAMDTLDEASDCLARRGDCDNAKRWYLEAGVQRRREGVGKDQARAEAEEVWKKLADETKCTN